MVEIYSETRAGVQQMRDLTDQKLGVLWALHVHVGQNEIQSLISSSMEFDNLFQLKSVPKTRGIESVKIPHDQNSTI